MFWKRQFEDPKCKSRAPNTGRQCIKRTNLPSHYKPIRYGIHNLLSIRKPHIKGLGRRPRLYILSSTSFKQWKVMASPDPCLLPEPLIVLELLQHIFYFVLCTSRSASKLLQLLQTHFYNVAVFQVLITILRWINYRCFPFLHQL
jgi:hypothetical protein